MQVFNPLGCTHQAILIDVPHQIWAGISSVSSYQFPSWLIRLIYNKLRFYPINYTQCYTHYLSPPFLSSQLGFTRLVLLTILILVLLHKIPPLHKPILIALLLYPLIMIFELYRLS